MATDLSKQTLMMCMGLALFYWSCGVQADSFGVPIKISDVVEKQIVFDLPEFKAICNHHPKG